MLAIAATAAADLFGLMKSGGAFTAAMLSIGGYDAIRLIEARWLHRVGLAEQGQLPGRNPDSLPPRD